MFIAAAHVSAIIHATPSSASKTVATILSFSIMVIVAANVGFSDCRLRISPLLRDCDGFDLNAIGHVASLDTQSQPPVFDSSMLMCSGQQSSNCVMFRGDSV